MFTILSFNLLSEDAYSTTSPPTFNAPATPTPPSTINAPVVLVVEAVVALMFTVLKLTSEEVSTAWLINDARV